MTLDRQISLLKRPRPAAWQFDGELLDLLWVLEHTFDLWPSLDQAIAYEVEKVEKISPNNPLEIVWGYQNMGLHGRYVDKITLPNLVPKAGFNPSIG